MDFVFVFFGVPLAIAIGAVFLVSCIAVWNMNFEDTHGQTPENKWAAPMGKKLMLTPLFAFMLTVGSIVNLFLLPFGKKIG